MLHDLMNDINPLPAIPPAAAVVDNTAFVSSVIDTLNYDSLTFVILTGALADVDATFAVTMLAGDDSGLSDGATPAAADMIGTLALAGFTFAADNATRKIGYIGAKRYVKLTVTPTGNTGNAFVSAVALLGHPRTRPTANPPA